MAMDWDDDLNAVAPSPPNSPQWRPYQPAGFTPADFAFVLDLQAADDETKEDVVMPDAAVETQPSAVSPASLIFPPWPATVLPTESPERKAAARKSATSPGKVPIRKKVAKPSKIPEKGVAAPVVATTAAVVAPRKRKAEANEQEEASKRRRHTAATVEEQLGLADGDEWTGVAMPEDTGSLFLLHTPLSLRTLDGARVAVAVHAKTCEAYLVAIDLLNALHRRNGVLRSLCARLRAGVKKNHAAGVQIAKIVREGKASNTAHTRRSVTVLSMKAACEYIANMRARETVSQERLDDMEHWLTTHVRPVLAKLRLHCKKLSRA
jgi:hypothetical protein